ncbi:MAG: hypothetical protein WAL86_05920 [Candidatus Acidiferrales bacterium]
MSSGFNTDVRAGDRVFHVQTEDRGPAHPIIDTVVYQSGRVVYRRASPYGDFASLPEFTSQALRQRVEDQHRAVVEDVRSGAIEDQTRGASQTAPPVDIEVQLLNPGSWLSAGNVSLDVAILRRADQQPEKDVHVEALIEGALQEDRHAAKTDEQGRVKIQFPLPPLGKGDLALVIQARAAGAQDEIRFAMRSRSSNPAAGPAPAGASS